MSYSEVFGTVNYPNYIPSPDDGYTRSATSMIIASIKTNLDSKTTAAAKSIDNLAEVEICGTKVSASSGPPPQSSGREESRTGKTYVADAKRIVQDYDKSNFAGGERNQKDYAVNSFVNFMYYVAFSMLENAPERRQPKRVILPLRTLEQTDASSSSGNPVYNLALEIREPNDDWKNEELFESHRAHQPLTEETNRHVLGCAVVANGDNKVSLEQLNTKHDEMAVELWGKQFNRVSVWGIVVKGSVVEVKQAGPESTSLTDPIDLTTEGGRGLFITYLVNLSYCEEHKLGFDPTVKYLKDLNCWEITVRAIDEKGNPVEKPYYGYSYSCLPFNRRDLSFEKYMYAKTTKPTLSADGSVPKYQRDGNDILIKDMWIERSKMQNWQKHAQI